MSNLCNCCNTTGKKCGGHSDGQKRYPSSSIERSAQECAAGARALPVGRQRRRAALAARNGSPIRICSRSSALADKCGVAQGGNMGPVLYFVFIECARNYWDVIPTCVVEVVSRLCS